MSGESAQEPPDSGGIGTDGIPLNHGPDVPEDMRESTRGMVQRLTEEGAAEEARGPAPMDAQELPREENHTSPMDRLSPRAKRPPWLWDLWIQVPKE